MCRTRLARPLVFVLLMLVALPALAAGRRFPDMVIVTIDTLRADRMSGYGYERQTSPRLDDLMSRGVRFTQARTPVGLTGPAMSTMVTSLHPHEHGATRNGLRIRPDLPSFAKILQRRGYETAGFVGNWTLQDRLSGLGEHFEVYEEILTKKRWWFSKREANADDISQMALDWLDLHQEERGDRPFLLWVHYVEPHAPYLLQEDFLEQVGLSQGGTVFSANNRYDTEVAFVDDAVGRFLDALAERIDLDETLVVFASDHGESLGEHEYWGHGRHLYEVTLQVPMAVVWPDRIDPGTVDAPAMLNDIPATVFGLAGFPVPSFMGGMDWAPVIRGEMPPPMDRVTYFQAHRGAVQARGEQVRVRRKGLLEVGRLEGTRKEILDVRSNLRSLYDLAEDPGELDNLVPTSTWVSDDLASWAEQVREGLALSDSLPPPSLSAEDLDELKALGYID